jgi:calcineurin-like phosphoesterase family protein
MSTLFTADTHFGHANIIRYCQRPFRDANHMNEVLIARWNAVVKPTDTVYHLGDFGTGPVVRLVRPRLNGTIRLILGNHDKIRLEEADLFKGIDHLKLVDVGGQRVVLCHYAMRTWQFQSKRAWQLYGHSHGNLPDDPSLLSLDVGVDCWDYTPVAMHQLHAAMNKKQWRPIDQHGRDDA